VIIHVKIFWSNVAFRGFYAGIGLDDAIVVLYVKIFYLKSVVLFMVEVSSLRYCLWLMVHHMECGKGESSIVFCL
jgi:hypothetical protein